VYLLQVPRVGISAMFRKLHCVLVMIRLFPRARIGRHEVAIWHELDIEYGTVLLLILLIYLRAD